MPQLRQALWVPRFYMKVENALAAQTDVRKWNTVDYRR
jgi:hypothetical protein